MHHAAAFFANRFGFFAGDQARISLHKPGDTPDHIGKLGKFSGGKPAQYNGLALDRNRYMTAPDCTVTSYLFQRGERIKDG